MTPLPFPRRSHALVIVTLIASILLVAPTARTAELDGVQLPSTMQVGAQELSLNGVGLRTYSILGIHIYVAGLYLEHLSSDAQEILRSHQTKVLTIKFKHDVGADASRAAWRTGLSNNCQAPCQLDPVDVEKFLADVPAMHAGESYTIVFTDGGAMVTADGTQIGTISKRSLAEAMLATFLGPAPASPSLKAALLQGH